MITARSRGWRWGSAVRSSSETASAFRHGEGVLLKLAVERRCRHRYTGDVKYREDDGPCAAGGSFTDAGEPCSHEFSPLKLSE